VAYVHCLKNRFALPGSDPILEALYLVRDWFQTILVEQLLMNGKAELTLKYLLGAAWSSKARQSRAIAMDKACLPDGKCPLDLVGFDNTNGQPLPQFWLEAKCSFRNNVANIQEAVNQTNGYLALLDEAPWFDKAIDFSKSSVYIVQFLTTCPDRRDDRLPQLILEKFPNGPDRLAKEIAEEYEGAIPSLQFSPEIVRLSETPAADAIVIKLR